MLRIFIPSVQNYPDTDHKYEHYNYFQNLILSISVNRLVRSNYASVHPVHMYTTQSLLFSRKKRL